MNIDISLVVHECSAYVGSSVKFSIYRDMKVNRFEFSFFQDEDCEHFCDEPDVKIEYDLADFEIKAISADLTQTLIGKFKFECENAGLV